MQITTNKLNLKNPIECNKELHQKIENYMNNVFAPWTVRMLFGVHWVVFMLILGQLALPNN